MLQRKLKASVVVSVYASLLIFFTHYFHRKRCHISMPFEDVIKTASHRVSSENLCMVDLNELKQDEKYIDVYIIPSLVNTKELSPAVKVGGTWKPANCQSLQKVAIIIPYRDRKEHLKILLHRLHPMLQKQQIDYRIFVVEQHGHDTYNKGKTMNIGFLEALKIDKFDCFIFHDVDLIPETNRNLYLCDKEIRHLSPAIDEMRYQLIYEQLLGGVLAIGPGNFRRINGYSTMYWGWGGEDDDLSARTEELNLTVSRPPNYIGRYKMIPHIKSHRAKQTVDVLKTWRSRWHWDGLNNSNSMAHQIIKIENKDLFTHIMIDVGPKPSDLLQMLRTLKQETDWWMICFYNP